MPVRKEGGNGAVRGAEAKRRLLDESIRLIDEQGLGGLSFREMARRAGVSHQAPYHHFTNREGILAAIAREGFERLNTRLSEVFESDRKASAQRTLRDLLRAYMTFAIGNRVYYRVMFRPELVNLKRFPEARAAATRAFQHVVNAVAACHRGMTRSNPRQAEIANALWAAAHGVADLWLDGPMRRGSAGQSIGSLIDLASEMYSEAGARVSARRVGSSRRK